MAGLLKTIAHDQGGSLRFLFDLPDILPQRFHLIQPAIGPGGAVDLHQGGDGIPTVSIGRGFLDGPLGPVDGLVGIAPGQSHIGHARHGGDVGVVGRQGFVEKRLGLVDVAGFQQQLAAAV
jgi:hypothetical protein